VWNVLQYGSNVTGSVVLLVWKHITRLVKKQVSNSQILQAWLAVRNAALFKLEEEPFLGKTRARGA
jgi:hypothetical protein